MEWPRYIQATLDWSLSGYPSSVQYSPWIDCYIVRVEWNGNHGLEMELPRGLVDEDDDRDDHIIDVVRVFLRAIWSVS